MCLPASPQVYAVTLHGETLKTDFRVINTGDQPFNFTAALHSYIEVLGIDKAKVRGGLGGLGSVG
jgi:glucose-6-phosphate 1-epimerase